ncbi:MAG: MBL fold metallo-hydrolase, partial [Lentisphaeraceae bacterium]|nr:MBL fold metallo-hydrolase [Lentisphaeraceae bacterium]
MHFHFLGTSAGSPSIERNVTALALTFEQRTGWYLFDCGEGTQQRILHTNLSLPRLEKIFITHMHGDHCYGLPGILTSRGLMSGSDNAIEIYGPKGIREFIETILKLSYTRLHFPIKYIEFNEAQDLYQDKREKVKCVELSHDVPSSAFVLEENERPGTFDVDKAKAEGIPPGPQFGKLSRGESIILEDGRKFNGEDFVGPTQKGRKIIISGDNDSPQLLNKELQGAALFIHESTHTEEVREKLSWKSKHSTAAS